MTSDKTWGMEGKLLGKGRPGHNIGNHTTKFEAFCLMVYETSAASAVQLLTYFITIITSIILTILGGGWRYPRVWFYVS